MKTNNDELKYRTILKELEVEILQKLKKIEDKIQTGASTKPSEIIPILLMVSEELDDVLLNWEDRGIPRSTMFDDDLDEEDEFDY